MEASIYIAVFKKKLPLLNNLITYLNRSDDFHVAISMDSTLEKMYSFKETVRIDNINKLKSEMLFSVYKHQVSPEQYNQLQSVLEESYANRMELSYNKIGAMIGLLVLNPLYIRGTSILIPLANLLADRKNKYYCSGYAAVMLKKSGIDIFSVNGVRVITNSIKDGAYLPGYFASQEFVCDYKGDVKGWHQKYSY